MIFHAYLSATDEDCRAVKVKAHKVGKIGTSLLFLCSPAGLNGGTWS